MAMACDVGKAPTVPVIKSLPYVEARAALLAGGWHPLPGHPHNDLSANELAFRGDGFTELQFCRLTADSVCRFAFSAPGGYVLWVSSTGDENAALQTRATVRSATVACDGDPDPEK